MKKSDKPATEKHRARNEEMVAMRQSNYRLHEIAIKYGVSRERVRQIIGNTGKNFISENSAKIVSEMIPVPLVVVSASTEGEIIARTRLGRQALKRLGILPGVHRTILNKSPLQVGVDAEDKFSGILTRMGIENTLMPTGHPYDILLSNGSRIDVKYCTKKIHPPSQKTPYYYFKIGANRKYGAADFYACMTGDFDDVFIVPYARVTGLASIRINYPPLKSDNSFARYVNDFAALQVTGAL